MKYSKMTYLPLRDWIVRCCTVTKHTGPPTKATSSRMYAMPAVLLPYHADEARYDNHDNKGYFYAYYNIYIYMI